MKRPEGRAADEQRLAEQRRKERVAREIELDDLRAVLSTPKGRRFFYRLIFDIAGVQSPSWSPSAEIHYKEGRRSVGIDLMLEAQNEFPLLYLNMIAERTEQA